MVKRDRGTLSAEETASLPQQICAAVDGVVRKQAETGLDIINDGEASKIGYATYVRERLSGFEGTSRGLTIWDLDEVPEFAGRALEGLRPDDPGLHRADHLPGSRGPGRRHQEPEVGDREGRAGRCVHDRGRRRA